MTAVPSKPSNATTWSSLANGWRTTGDVECYCGPGGSSYPLTDWEQIWAGNGQANQQWSWAYRWTPALRRSGGYRGYHPE